ncbi:hypothetical protein, partial [Mycobacterium sp. GA-2829]|uniref:hypothetical protein n=1 Tax=Mycobacterium sp. GA-2829 TaxID=1772283 RepID=UPI000AD8DA29
KLGRILTGHNFQSSYKDRKETWGSSLQLGGSIAFAQAVFLSVDVNELFADLGFTAVTDILM